MLSPTLLHLLTLPLIVMVNDRCTLVAIAVKHEEIAEQCKLRIV
jgi:hypothetical protein